ncbi:MAG: methyltransferase domain-containing protein [Bacillota bacterium]|nr:methyltransferase domain-containing protein [Bacillota bacterium]
MHHYLLEMLKCPACGGELRFHIEEEQAGHIEWADIRCTACGAEYPVREGIGVFLTPDLPRHDLWEQVESGLDRYLRDHPDIEDRLLNSDPGTLAAADRFFRAMVLEERGDYAGAAALEAQAGRELYTDEYNAAVDSQMKYLCDRLAGHHPASAHHHATASHDHPAGGQEHAGASQGHPPPGRVHPVVDLASGRCGLVEKLARHLDRPVVASDFSPRVLRRDRRYLEFAGLYDRVSLLAFDARRTPFRDVSVTALTTFAGLANIEHPGDLLRELRRIVSGTFYAISCFYAPDDRINREAIEAHGLHPFLFRDTALDLFNRSGWRVEVVNTRRARALPTPRSALIPEAGIDALPVAETTLEWCTLVAT